MAKRLDTFPSEGRRTPEKRYPWEEWTDGSVWEIRQGQDYEISTENMRVNLHMQADAKAIKVRTKKIRDEQGEGLVFEFFDPDGNETEERMAAVSEDEREAALRLLYQDAMRLYERAREEVTIPWSDGRTGPYVAVRYKQTIEKTQDNKALLVPTIAGMVKKKTSGFGHLEAANRPDLMVETLILDDTKPYHRFFTATTIEVARQRLQQHGYLAGGDC